ncbi:MAG TPA: apolipoprotein N-acyltransferase, partial [Stenomitos sp.]
VLLPEGALPFLWGRSYGLEAPLLRAVQAAKVPLWAGVFMPQGEGYHQSLLSLTADGVVSGQYNKVKLVPLGEYLPFEQWIKPVLSRLSPLKVGMIAGENHQRFDTAIGRAIVGICYDSVFSELFRFQAAAGGQFILSVANNDPFGARMMGQHHALDVLRAIETDRWLIRATNTGISAVIDPQGHSQWISPTNVSLTHIAKIERRTTQTLYVRVGNWFLPLCLAFSIALWFKYRDRPNLI